MHRKLPLLLVLALLLLAGCSTTNPTTEPPPTNPPATYTPPDITPEEMQQRYNEVYSSLSEDDKRLVAEKDLIWNGYEFSRPSSVVMPSRASQSSVTTFQAQAAFDCPLEDSNPNNDKDHGTFYLLGSKPGTAEQPIQVVTASFELPAGKNISNVWDDQELYALITGWGSDIGPDASAFDAGLGYQDTGWYMMTNRFVGGADLIPEEAVTAHPYRLRNLDGSGNVIPEDQNTAPYNVNMTVELLDGKIRATIEPVGSTAWVNPFKGVTNLDAATGKPAPLVLGGAEVDGENEGNPKYNPDGTYSGMDWPFPDQVVPGINASGVDNRVSVQVNAARDYDAPAIATKAPGIRVYNAKINGKPWNAASEQNEFFGFTLTCPKNNAANAYNVGAGTTDSETGLSVDIDIKQGNVHDTDKDGANDGDEVFAGTDPSVPDFVSSGSNSPGWCYVPFGSFKPCPEDDSPLHIGGTPTSENALLLTGENCTGTFEFVNTGSSDIVYQVSGVYGDLKIRSGNAVGTVAAGQSIPMTIQYVGEAKFYEEVPGNFGEGTRIVERKIVVFERSTPLGMVTAQADASCAGQ
ncbi:MAG: thrombospondin type 3 repeat-containing protein [Trueperaceae bacterium]